MSKRGESKLEAFHDRLAHFANCGMRDTLADNLNLAGTSRFNLAIRHKRTLMTTKNPLENPKSSLEKRQMIPAGWEKVVPFFNHTELWHVNKMAQSVGCTLPFPTAETSPEDNGERFFSLYIKTLKDVGNGRGEYGECLCKSCSDSSIPEPSGMTDIPQNTTTTSHQHQTVAVAPTTRKVNQSKQPTTRPTPTACLLYTSPSPRD